MFKQLPSIQGGKVTVVIDDRKLEVSEGISAAAAVLASGIRHTRNTPISGAKRAPYCMMGVCFDCLMVIDGKANQRACATLVRDGMRIESQQAKGPEIEGAADE